MIAWLTNPRLPHAVAACVGVALATLLAVILLLEQQHRRAYQDVELAILELSVRKPDSMTPSQWSMCLVHTWNLHANYGPKLTPRDLLGIADLLRADRDELETINDCWTKYVSLTAGRAARYDAAYRPTARKLLDEVAGDTGRAYDTLEDWIARYHVARGS